MTDKHGPEVTLLINRARRLLDQGQVQEALAVALDALWRELDQLRAALGAIQEHLPTPQGEAPAQGSAAETSEPQVDWPEPPSRLLH
jgi:hypothetical protein